MSLCLSGTDVAWVEVAEACKFLGLTCALEPHKRHPQHFDVFGRIRVALKAEDGSPTHATIHTKKQLFAEIARVVPTMPSRVARLSGAAAGAGGAGDDVADSADGAAAGAAAGGAGGGKVSKKAKKKKKKRR